MPRRIRRPKDKSDLLGQLGDLENGGVFETYKDALVFAAALGYHRDVFRPFEKSDEPIEWNVFKANDRALINMLGLAKTKELKILSNDDEVFDERLKIFEGYANGGLEVLQNEIMDSTKPLLESLTDFLMSLEQEHDGGALPHLRKLVDSGFMQRREGES